MSWKKNSEQLKNEKTELFGFGRSTSDYQSNKVSKEH